MDQQEDALAQAERHVREGKGHVAKQIRLLAHPEQHGCEAMAEDARQLLVALERTLGLARDHVRTERKERALEP